MSFRAARSPDAPKMTTVSGVVMVVPAGGGGRGRNARVPARRAGVILSTACGPSGAGLESDPAAVPAPPPGFAPVNNTCPTCGAVYNVAAKDIGRRIRCKKCATGLTVSDAGLELDEPMIPPVPTRAA